MDLKSCRRCAPLLSFSIVTGIVALALGFDPAVCAQLPDSQKSPSPTSAVAANKHTVKPKVQATSEEELRPQLAGKTFYLRAAYMEDQLHFNERGSLVGNSSKGSYTLAMIKVERIHLTKRELTLQGVRYGLHFLGEGPSEDPIHTSDMVRITPQKKSVKITIDRAQVEKPDKRSRSDQIGTANASSAPGQPNASAWPSSDPAGALSQSAVATGAPSTMNSESGPYMTQARANRVLREALDRVFSMGLDDRMIASLPDFWRLYYQAAEAKADYRPSDPSILRQNTVDRRARLITNFVPPSNDFAQAAGVAGSALYHVVIAPDGRPAEIVVGHPIGLGLDENAVDSIRRALFQPAFKDGKPVPVLVDLVVQFRIFSKRTGAPVGPNATAAELAQPEATLHPGPYTANGQAPKRP